ncbi:MAG: YjdF family protein [Coriobacteriales bacterium]|nr:YjdF family protein [Coriobacteriales bacterium]
MQEIRVSSALTIYFDGQFWVGIFEREQNQKLSVCRVVFGAEPSNEEVQQFVCENWNHLRFTEPIEHSEAPKVVINPKRRQREAARELKQRGPSTKAQMALLEEREALARQQKEAARAAREQDQQQRYDQHREKQKQKHRGR